MWPHHLSPFREDVALNFLRTRLQYDLKILDADPGACRETLGQAVEDELEGIGLKLKNKKYRNIGKNKFGGVRRRKRLPLFSRSERETNLVRHNYS